MLPDFVNGTEYYFDFEIVEKMLDNVKKGTYDVTAKMQLLQFEPLLKQSFFNFRSRICKEVKYHNESEIFQKKYSFETCSIIFQFQIDVLTHYVNQNKINKEVAPISVFTSPNSFIDFSKESDCYYKKDLTPIYVVPFITLRHTGLVVDGNHRLSACIDRKIPFISICNFNDAQASTALMSEFEMNFYLFLLRYNRLHQAESKSFSKTHIHQK